MVLLKFLLPWMTFLGFLACFCSPAQCLILNHFFQKRAALYELCAKPFLDYFASSDRLVTVDVTCGVADFIWHRVHLLLCDLDFHPDRTVNTVVVFAFGENYWYFLLSSPLSFELAMYTQFYIMNTKASSDYYLGNLLYFWSNKRRFC